MSKIVRITFTQSYLNSKSFISSLIKAITIVTTTTTINPTKSKSSNLKKNFKPQYVDSKNSTITN